MDAVTVVLVLATTAIFAGLTFGLGRRLPDDARRALPIFAVLDAVLTLLAAVIVLRAPDEGWVVLFYFGATAASLLLPERRALALIGFAGVAAAVCLARIDDLPTAVGPGRLRGHDRRDRLRDVEAAPDEPQAVHRPA